VNASRRKALRLGLGAAAAALVGRGRDAHAASGSLSSLHASFKYVGGAKGKAKVDKAIDHAIGELPAGLYDIAYKRLSETQDPAKTIVLDIEGSDIRVERKPSETIRTTASKPKRVVFTKYGERYVWRQSVKGNTVVQTVSGVGNKTRMSYTLSEDGSKLTFKVFINADLLPHPVEYRLSYKRV
jgi:hypothetical protein